MRRPAKRVLLGAAVAAAALYATAYSGQAQGWKKKHGTIYRVVNIRGLDRLHAHVAPAENAPRIGALPFDAREIYGLGQCTSSWCLVRYGTKIMGWVQRRYIATDDGATETTYSVVGVSKFDILKIRERPSAEGGIVGAIPPFEITVNALGPCVAEWCPVSYKEMQGWVRRNHLSVWIPRQPRYERRIGGY